MVPTRRETRAGRREGASRRCSGNAWDLRRSSPRRRSPLAGIDSHRLKVWSRDRIIFCALPLDRLAERDQEDAPVGQEHLLVDRPRVTFRFPLKHLEQLVNPAGFPQTVAREARELAGLSCLSDLSRLFG